MLEVCLLGTGGMMPLPGRALTAMMTRYNGSSLLIDCGEGTQVGIRKRGWSFHPIDTICFTHYHGDHISGLPGLLLSIGNADRTEPITLMGPRGLETVVKALTIIAPALPFPLEFIEIKEDIFTFQQKGYCITAFRVNHNTPCYGYSISIPRAGKFSSEKAEVNEVPMRIWNKLQKGNTVEWEGRVFTPDMILGEERKGLKVVYCTDTRPVKSIAENAENADLFICEGMYGDDMMLAGAKDKKHMTFSEAAVLAREANVDELWLTHFSPALVRPGDYMEEIKKIFRHVNMGKDGKSKELVFEKEDEDGR